MKPTLIRVRQELGAGPYPTDDGWRWLYRLFGKLGAPLRKMLCAYWWPARFELAGNGRLYKVLGVDLFGRIIPTGGVFIRRITGSRMKPYTLKGTSIGAARDFFYRTCVFETLHFPFFITLVLLALHRWLIGRPDLAVENTVVNLVFNVYPMMHHRRTRARIVRLLSSARQRKPSGELMSSVPSPRGRS